MYKKFEASLKVTENRSTLFWYILGLYQARPIDIYIELEYSSTATYCNVAPVCFISVLVISSTVEGSSTS